MNTHPIQRETPTLEDAIEAAAATWDERGVPPLSEWIEPARRLRGQIDIIRALWMPDATATEVRALIEARVNEINAG